MTDWQDKYKDLKVGQFAWYWHKEINILKEVIFTPIKVYRGVSGVCEGILYAISEESNTWVEISEDFPNGPKCLTPDDVIALAEELQSINKALDYINKENIR